MKKRLFIIHDFAVFRDTLQDFLSRRPDLEIVGVCDHENMDVAYLRSCRPDFALVGVHAHDLKGIQSIRAIRAECPDVRVIAMTATPDGELQRKIRRAGARDCFLIGNACDDLVALLQNG